MAKQKKYNGWANYETWNVALWFGNDEGLYNSVRAHRDCAGKFNGKTADAFVSELLPDGTPDFQNMGKARCYAKVRWTEIARTFNEM
jgi:hypothetical protein